MQLKTVALVLPALALVAGCAGGFGGMRGMHGQPGAMAGTCDMPHVPRGAVFGTANGRDIATWPPEVPDDGCQRVWHGNRAQPAQMGVLATYHYRGGHVERLAGRVPGGSEYECHYRRGQLDQGASRNPQHCPSAEELDRRRRR